MVFPPIATVALGAVIVAILGVVDWYVWRVMPVRSPVSRERTRAEERDADLLRKVA